MGATSKPENTPFLYGTRKVNNVTAPSKTGYTSKEVKISNKDTQIGKDSIKNVLDNSDLSKLNGKSGAVIIVW